MMAERTSGPVLSMGEVLIDFIVSDGSSSLETAESFVARAGGAPANVAVALARLGIASAYGGVVGDDPLGSRLRRGLRSEGVDTSRLRQSREAATTLAFAWKDDRGDGHFWLLRGADASLSATDITATAIAGCAALVVGSVSLAAQPARDAILHAVAIAVDGNVPVVFDVNLRPSIWRNPDDALALCEAVGSLSRIVKLSLDDANGLYGASASPESVIPHLLGLGALGVVLTDGERGCWYGTKDRPLPAYVPAFSVSAVEPTGAGDAFCATLIDRLLRSCWSSLSNDDIRYAAAAGALATTRQGAWEGLPSRRQLDEFVKLTESEKSST